MQARILAVADIFTALREDRSYRPAMTTTEALQVLREEVGIGRIDGRVVDLLASSLEEIDRAGATSRGENCSTLCL